MNFCTDSGLLGAKIFFQLLIINLRTNVGQALSIVYSVENPHLTFYGNYVTTWRDACLFKS